jgi:multidrug efflux pump subunit AcrB
MRDVSTVADSFQVQTNIVCQEGHRAVVKGVRAMLPFIATIVPPQLRMVPLSDPSIFVRAAVTGVIRETVIAAALTALMIMLFLGS